MHSIAKPAVRPTILVVEDEPLIREMTAGALEQAGFDVIAVAAAEDALGLMVMDVAFDALFTDIELAGALDGWELAGDVRAARPDIPIVCTSGSRHGREPMSSVPGAVFLPKPYCVDRVGDLLWGMLTAAGCKSSDTPAQSTAEWALSA